MSFLKAFAYFNCADNAKIFQYLSKKGKCIRVMLCYRHSCSRLCVFAYEYFIFIGRVRRPSAKPPVLEDQFVSLSLASLRSFSRETRDLWNTRLEIQTQTKLDQHFEKWTTPDSRNTPSTTNLEEEEIVDPPGNDGNASMPEQVKRPNPWRKMMMMMMMISVSIHEFNSWPRNVSGNFGAEILNNFNSVKNNLQTGPLWFSYAWNSKKY